MVGNHRPDRQGFDDQATAAHGADALTEADEHFLIDGPGLPDRLHLPPDGDIGLRRFRLGRQGQFFFRWRAPEEQGADQDAGSDRDGAGDEITAGSVHDGVQPGMVPRLPWVPR